MSAHLLTIDLGNSRCKLRLWSEAGEPLRDATLSVAGSAREELVGECDRWLSQGPTPDHAALSAVGRAALEGSLRSALSARIADGLVRTPEPGLDLDVRSPETVGSDRLFGVRAAAVLLGESAIVLDAGTALTVDVLEYRAGRPVFRGGAITLGPSLTASALREHVARLPEFEARPGVPALGRDTRAALAAGTVHGFRGAARELVEALSQECDLTDAPLILTGGAALFLLHPRPFVARPIEVVEQLVHVGLLAALRDELVRTGDRA